MKRKLIGVAASIVFAALTLTACGEQVAAPQTQPTAEEGTQMEEAIPSDSQTYVSNHGWSVTYDPALFTVNEAGDDVSFVYQGESAGTSMVTISYVGAKQPEEVLFDVTSQWADIENIQRVEGFFPGTDDKWGYWRTVNPAADGSGLSETAIAGEYNGGVLLFDVVAHMSGDNSIDVPTNDSLSELINTITYDSFEPQKMYEYIPGTYIQQYSDELDAKEVAAEYTVTLKEDHTGTIAMQDSVDILWGSYELIAADGSFRYEYTIEGDDLLINLDDNWVAFSKEGSEAPEDDVTVQEDVYLGTWAEKTAERVVLHVTPANEEGWYDIEITWREDLPQKDVYDMRAHLQDDGSLYYDNCRYVIRTFEGDSFTDDIQYQSGSGLLYYDEDAGELYWTDYEVDSKENVTTFIKAD